MRENRHYGMNFIFSSWVRNLDKGFTLIELMVVVIITGILMAIALPNILGQVGKAREAEAKQMLSGIGMAQEAYFFEKRSFADSLDRLDAATISKYYTFTQPTLLSSGSTALHEAHAINASGNNTRNYALGIYYNINGYYEIVICESNDPATLTQAPNTSTGSCIGGNKLN